MPPVPNQSPSGKQPAGSARSSSALVKLITGIDHALLDPDSGAPLDPRFSQGWWAGIDTAARRTDVIDTVVGQATSLLSALSSDAGPLADERLRITGFYLAWMVFRRTGLRSEQFALLAALDSGSSPHPLASYGGSDLTAAFRGLLTAETAPTGDVLRPYYEAADLIADRYASVIAFIRLRRSIGLALLETDTPGAGVDERAHVLSRVREDFAAERTADPRWSTPQLKAEVLLVESRLHCLSDIADYSTAIRLVLEARTLDQRAEGEDWAAYRVRAASYDQHLAWIRSLARLHQTAEQLTADAAKASAASEQRIREQMNGYRRDSVQQVGLLAAVVALLTSLTGARSGATIGETIVELLMAGGVITVVFAMFALAFGSDQLRVRFAVLAVGLGLLATTAILFALAPAKARFG